jgi:hypothetical protein
MARVRVTDRSLRSTGERLSKCKEGSFKIAFQLPTPCCQRGNERERDEHALPHEG